MGVLGQLSDTSLTRERAFRDEKDGLPNSFVPGRNLLFFTFAAAIAWRRDIRNLVAACARPTSRAIRLPRHTLKALQVALNLAWTAASWLQHAADVARQGRDLGARRATGRRAADRDHPRAQPHLLRERARPRHAWGYGCGRCPACALRQRGFEMWRNEKCAAHDHEHAQGLGLGLFHRLHACIPTANWMIGHVGTVCAPNGPCLLPVWPWGANGPLMAPSGVTMIGLALVLRDLVQRRLGRPAALMSIVAGAALSGPLRRLSW